MIRVLILLSAALLGHADSTAKPTRPLPTHRPSRPPTFKPSRSPVTHRPSQPPRTRQPTTHRPSKLPTFEPTKRPSNPPTVHPTHAILDPIVMTHNLYLGADLTRITDALNQGGDVAAAATLSLQIALGPNNFNNRVGAIVDEINTTQPDLIAFQEVTLMTTGTDNTIVADYKTALLNLLPDYAEVITTAEGQFSVPGVASLQTSNMILHRKRADLVVSDARSGVYIAQAPSINGSPNQRNWQAVDVKLGSKNFVFLNTHLESDNNAVSTVQGLELVAGPLKTTKRVVLVGDFNSGQGLSYHGAYDALTDYRQGKLRDLVVSGVTCCRAELLSVTEPQAALYERIDLVLTSLPISLVSASRIGVEQVNGLYPSDHAGLVARLRVP